MNRFDDWEVDCADCQHYWDDSCNGVPEGQKRNCTAFVATKKVDIPKQIEQLKTAVKVLGWLFMLTLAWNVICSIAWLVQP